MKDNKADNNLQYDNPDDILAMLQGFQEDDVDASNDIFAIDDSDTMIGNENIDMNNIEYGTTDQDSMDNDLLALLDMISKQDETEKDIVAFDDQAVISDDLSNDYSNDDLQAYSKLWEEDTDFSLDTDAFDNGYESKTNEMESSDIGDIFSDVLSVLKNEKDDEFFTPSDFDKLSFDNISTNKTSDIQQDQDNTGNEEDLFINNKHIKENKTSLLSKLFSKPESIKEKEIKVEKAKKAKKTKVKKLKPSKDSETKDTTEAKKKVKTQKAKKSKDEDTKKSASKKKSSIKKDNSKKKEKDSKIKLLKEKFNNDLSEPENTKPLNKSILVATVLLVASIGVFVTIGSKAYAETISEKNATWNFKNKRYDEAYNDIVGQKITVRNKEIHEKITTVMYVNHFYNSHFTLYELEKYPEALDALIQGLRNYDRNIENAASLGIQSNLDEIRENILNELDDKFNINAKTAVKLSKTDDKLEYSKKVHTIVGNLK